MPTSMIRSSAIYPPPIIWILNANSPRLPDGIQGTAYAFGLGAFGGALPYTWSVFSHTGFNVWTIPGGVLTCANLGFSEIDYVTVQVTDATGNNSATTTLEVIVTPRVAATPTFSPVAGTYNSPQSITISTTTPAASIYYTTDGSIPMLVFLQDNVGNQILDSSGNFIITS